jgi:hypothetical protein
VKVYRVVDVDDERREVKRESVARDSVGAPSICLMSKNGRSGRIRGNDAGMVQNWRIGVDLRTDAGEH